MKKKMLFSIFLVLLVLILLQRLVMPKYMSKNIEGAFIAEYYKEKMNHDVLFIGDCEVYESFSPIYLYQNFGINSYIRGSASQSIIQSYYFLEEMLKKEKPKVVIFNVLSMKYNESQKEAYNRMSIDNMKWNLSKIKMIKESKLKNEYFIEYLFPILRFNDRIFSLTRDDFKYFWNKKQITHNGYYLRSDISANTEPFLERFVINYEFSDKNYEYLNKIKKICEKNNIVLILIKAPSLYPIWHKKYDEQIKNYAKNNNLVYINFLDKNIKLDVNIDYSTDTYDKGLHMNVYGANKLSEYLGNFLKQNYDIYDARNDKNIKKIYDKKISKYEEDLNEQLIQIKKYGRITMYD